MSTKEWPNKSGKTRPYDTAHEYHRDEILKEINHADVPKNELKRCVRRNENMSNRDGGCEPSHRRVINSARPRNREKATGKNNHKCNGCSMNRKALRHHLTRRSSATAGGSELSFQFSTF
jgi:hypothetical protein